MCLLLESIKIANNQPLNLALHQQRLNDSRRALFGASESPIQLSELLNTQALDPSVVYKARVEYGRQVERIDITPYSRRPVKSIRLVEASDLAYDHKYADRTALNRLFDAKGTADDVLIVKNDMVTDCSYSNICLWDGQKWITPSIPLLKGTKRELLLRQGAITEQPVNTGDLPLFEKISLINAMLDLGNVVLPISQVTY